METGNNLVKVNGGVDKSYSTLSDITINTYGEVDSFTY
jgi:hypothetical protein